MKTKTTILCLVTYYLPGVTSGGPVRSIANFVENLGDEFNILIICRDRDFGSLKSYSNVKIDNWNLVGKSKVFYASNRMYSFFGIMKLLRETSYDIIHLNGLFSYTSSIIPLLLRFFYLIERKPCLLAVRGQLAQSAIIQKYLKKKFFLLLAKFFGLYKDLYWLASTKLERSEIYNEFGRNIKKISVINDLVIPIKIFKKKSKTKSNPLRAIFISRITPVKNLAFLLSVLSDINVSIELSVYGPVEDIDYWKRCKKLIKKLPLNIKVNVKKKILYDQVYKVFFKHDIFLFPTKGENFGHAIWESLSASTPVLVSDRTFWQTDKFGGLVSIPLNKKIWIKKIEDSAALSSKYFAKRSLAAFNYSQRYLRINKKEQSKLKKLFFSITKE
jgi:glycosyltransferase involved in cell wall biosynthesis